jgi:hypothetical protein
MTETVASTSITPQQTEWTTEGSAAAPPQRTPPVVDPSPYAAPIALNNESLEKLLTEHPAPASDRWVMALQPNRYEDATTGPDRQIDPNVYVEMTKPGGGTFLSPLSNVAYYRRKGFTEGAEQRIPDLVAYWAERARGTMSEEIVEGQTEQPDQPPDEVLLRYAGVPKTPEELEQERLEAEDIREGRAREGETAEERQRREEDERRRRSGQPPEHPLGGPPGQTGEHPVGGPPGQTGEPPNPPGGPPLEVNQGPAEQPEGEPKAP